MSYQRYKTLEDIKHDIDIFEQAIPCNMAGVSRSFIEAIDLMRQMGMGTDEINHHEYTKAFVKTMDIMTM